MNTTRIVIRFAYRLGAVAAAVAGLLLVCGPSVASESCDNLQDAFDTSYGACPLFSLGACSHQESLNCSIGCQYAYNWNCYNMGTRNDCLIRTRTGRCNFFGSCIPTDTPPPYGPPVTNPVMGSQQCS